MSANALPTGVYDSLFTKLVRVLEVTQHPEPVLTPQAKQALFQVTTAFKEGINQAKDLANALPGGELLIEEQNEIIAMLEELRDLKRKQLAQFSACALSSSGRPDEAETKMEIDSTASSPHG